MKSPVKKTLDWVTLLGRNFPKNPDGQMFTITGNETHGSLGFYFGFVFIGMQH